MMKKRLILLWNRYRLVVDILIILTIKVPFFMVGWSAGKAIGLIAASFWVGIKDSWRDVKCD